MEKLQVVHLEMVRDKELFYDGQITNREKLYELAKQMDKNPDRERVYLCGVDSSNTPVFLEMLSQGGINECLVDIRNVFKSLLLANCSSFFLWHNHTSAAPIASSDADRNITKSLYKAGKLMRIRLDDHLIINEKGYHSVLSELIEEDILE